MGRRDRNAADELINRLTALYKDIRRLPDAEGCLRKLLTDADPAVRAWAASHSLDMLSTEAQTELSILQHAEGAVGEFASYILSMWRAGYIDRPRSNDHGPIHPNL